MFLESSFHRRWEYIVLGYSLSHVLFDLLILKNWRSKFLGSIPAKNLNDFIYFILREMTKLISCLAFFLATCSCLLDYATANAERELQTELVRVRHSMENYPIGGWYWTLDDDCTSCRKEARRFRDYYKSKTSSRNKKITKRCKKVENPNVRTLKLNSKQYFCTLLRPKGGKGREKDQVNGLKKLLKKQSSTKKICKEQEVDC